MFSVVVKEDKKLLTVLFPDGRDGRGDGRAFTLKVPLPSPSSPVTYLLNVYFHFEGCLLCVLF